MHSGSELCCLFSSLVYYMHSIECNDLSVYDHNNRGYSRSRYELGNKCVIMTHCLIEIICCCCLIDRSQL